MINEKPFLCSKGKTFLKTKRTVAEWTLKTEDLRQVRKERVIRNQKTLLVKLKLINSMKRKILNIFKWLQELEELGQNYNVLLYIINDCLKLMQSFRGDTIPAQEKIIEESDTLALRLWKYLIENLFELDYG